MSTKTKATITTKGRIARWIVDCRRPDDEDILLRYVFTHGGSFDPEMNLEQKYLIKFSLQTILTLFTRSSEGQCRATLNKYYDVMKM